MTYKMRMTGFEGFPVQYPIELVEELNQVFELIDSHNVFLNEIGREISEDFMHLLYPKTEDGYDWFGGLEFNLKGSNVAVLFPWSQDWDNPETQMDRSVNVYSDEELPTRIVKDLLEKITYQVVLRIKEKERIKDIMRILSQ